jgi:hypothetical protein
LVGDPSQFAKPDSQLATTHCPATHPDAALGTAQRLLQRPQWFVSDCNETQPAPHAVIPGAQRHAPIEHTCPAAHARPHAPQ